MDTGRSKFDALSVDLLAVIVLTVSLNIAVFAPVVRDTLLRIPLGFVFVFFIPGYVFIAAVYPERYQNEKTSQNTDRRSLIRTVSPHSNITVIERCLLAVAFSIIIVPMIGFILNFTRWGVRLAPVLLSTTGFTILTAVAALIRRRRLPPENQFRLHSPGWMTGGYRKWIGVDTRTYAVNILLIASIVFFAASIGYAVTGQSSGEQYSELSLMEDSGTFVNESVSDQIESETSHEISMRVSNHEGQELNYTVVTVQQDIAVNGNQTTVRDQTQLDRFEMNIQDNETQVREQTFTPLATNDDSRVVWLLYTDDVPPEPSTQNADYHVHLWVTGSGS